MISAIILLAGGAALLLAVAFQRWATINNGYFERRGMAYLRPNWLFGSTGGFFLQLQRPDEYFKWLYAQFPHDKLFGIFDFRKPMIVLRDPELIKRMLVKDFDHFENHRMFFEDINAVNEVIGSALISLRGNKWRHMRATLSPAFTGRKMRSMFELVNDCCADMCAELRRRVTKDADNDDGSAAPIVLDMKETFSRYANDVIATTAFGHRVNSFADEKNAFLTFGRRLFNFNSYRTIAKFAMFQLFPRLFRALDLHLFDAEAMGYFTSMVLDTMRQRREQSIQRPDMINLLMQLKSRSDGVAAEKSATDADEPDDGFATADDSTAKTDIGQRFECTDNDIVAQCFMFFVAGYDATSTMLAFLAYELAVNPDVQQQLYEECHAMQLQLQSESSSSWRLPYDQLQHMPYMDQVVCEALRMWPPTMFTDRECSRTYAYEDKNDGLRFEIEAGTNVWIPIAGLHHDVQYFHDPEHFMPERFSDENRGTIVPGSFLPFGVGPRNCIASRFALMEVKAVIYHLLLAFSFEPTITTQIPLRLAPGQNTKPERGIHLELKRRN